MKAIWKGETLAESNNTKVVENNHYFPPDAVNSEFFQSSDTHSQCPWKGKASYYNIKVGGNKNEDAAWYYSEPFEAAEEIKDHVAFWKGVGIKG